jgi:hypothetical protein
MWLCCMKEKGESLKCDEIVSFLGLAIHVGFSCFRKCNFN